MNKDERMKILEMLKEGIINPEEAEKLLNAIDGDTEIVPSKKKFRMLRVYVDSADGDKVRIQIPIEFAKLLKTNKFNVNLSSVDLDVDQLIELIDSGVVGEIVNVDSADGDKVRIVVE